MKTTVELDEARLKRVMRLANVRTRREAVDLALREAERAFRINQLLANPLPGHQYADAVDADYDVLAQRQRERPSKR